MPAPAVGLAAAPFPPPFDGGTNVAPGVKVPVERENGLALSEPSC